MEKSPCWHVMHGKNKFMVGPLRACMLSKILSEEHHEHYCWQWVDGDRDEDKVQLVADV